MIAQGFIWRVSRVSDFILELYSEEIPATLQRDAAVNFRDLFIKTLVDHDISVDISSVVSYVAPQRLVILATGLLLEIAPRRDVIRGPRVGASPAALQGFMKRYDIRTKAELKTHDDSKGAVYFYETATPARPMAHFLADILPSMLGAFVWQKSMRWNETATRWVRPLRGILCCFDGAVVPFSFGGIRSGNTTRGHRFMAPHDDITITRCSDYLDSLRAAKVMADHNERARYLSDVATRLAEEVGGVVVVDEALVDEISGLVDWPVPLLGQIDQKFMNLPPVILRAVMRKHQKYLSVAKAGNTKDTPLPYFIVIANIEAHDDGKAIIDGNQRVLRARLSDAQFFFDQDIKKPLEERYTELKNIREHPKLGTLYEKSGRMEKLVQDLIQISDMHSADKSDKQTIRTYRKAARLAKVDLTTLMVQEFPELQGIIGGLYYATQNQPHTQETYDIEQAIGGHYLNFAAGVFDDISKATILVTLADRLDTLAQFWCIDERPSGSKDPYGLRRCALDILRLILEAPHIELPLQACVQAALKLTGNKKKPRLDDLTESLSDFFVERLKAYLRDHRGIRPDIVTALCATHAHQSSRLEDPDKIQQLATALNNLITSPEGEKLLEIYWRAAGIGKGIVFDEKIEMDNIPKGVERDLLKTLQQVRRMALTTEILVEDGGDVNTHYKQSIQDLYLLHAPLYIFLDNVRVDVDDSDVRARRLNLLAGVVDTMNKIADFSLIERTARGAKISSETA